MSYRRSHRSPTCSNCYSQGHTKRFCPAMRGRAILAAAKPESERTWGENRAIEKVKEYDDVSRACRYCTGTGHNARGCTIRKQDIAVATNKLVAWRKRFFENASIAGCGIGALIRHKNYSYSAGAYAKSVEKGGDGYHYAIIIGYNEQYLTHTRTDYTQDVLTVKSLNDFAGKPTDNIGMPVELHNRMNPDFRQNAYDNYTEVVSGSFGVGFDSSSLTSFAVCEKVVLVYINQKMRANKTITRYDMINTRHIDQPSAD